MAYHHGDYGHWYHGDWHDHYHWDHPWHYGPVGWWSAGFVVGGFVTAAVVWDAPWRWGYWPYYNPYYTEVIVIDNTPIDYSRPIVVATPSPATQVAAAGQQAADGQAEQALDAARDAFVRSDYASAMTQVNRAIVLKPNDTVPHEFRGLVLFALHRYKEAAASLYAVLSVGPGWDWTTMSSLYTDVNVYTEQLRDLEKYVNANPSSADARFVLAYHYLTCGHTDSAAAQFKAVVRLNPKDQLSAQILHALDTTDTAKQPATAAASSKPVKAATLVGNWKAKRADGKTIALNLSNDGKYTWTFAQNDKPQAFSGDYSVADNLLVLKQAGTPMMVGQVTPTAADGFNFKLPGDNPDDPGLTFGK
jgi:tetratricopeptide (TPR) repeat protein